MASDPVIDNFIPAFHSKLIIEDNGGFPFVLYSALTYVTNVGHRGTISVPEGFRTDYASIPRGLWNILPPVGSYDAAAVVHDYCYQNGTLMGVPLTRGDADAILNEAMQVLHVPTWQRRLIYAGVRIGGWAVWKKYRGQ
jgi:hypothetical protein